MCANLNTISILKSKYFTLITNIFFYFDIHLDEFFFTVKSIGVFELIRNIFFENSFDSNIYSFQVSFIWNKLYFNPMYTH